MISLARDNDVTIPNDMPPHSCEGVLEKFRAEAATHFGAAGVRVVPVAFDDRDFSYVIRAAIRFPGEDAPKSHVFIKVFKPRPLSGNQKMGDRVMRDFETTRRIHETMSRSPDFGAVRPLACYPDQLAIVTEETQGQTLGALLNARARWFPEAETLRQLEQIVGTVGRWVRAFQALDEQSSHFSLDEFRAYVDVRLERLVRLASSSFAEADRSRVLAHIDTLASLVPVSDLTEVLVHADLAPGNVLVAGRRVVVLDFAMTHRGSVLQDVSRLHVQLDLMRAKPYFRDRVIRRLQRSLLQGFEPTLTDDHVLFRLLSMRHHINHLTTLSERRERFPASVYNVHLRRAHRRWIERELASGPDRGLR